MKNKLIRAIMFSCLSLLGFGQDNEVLNFLESDSTWTKEIIEFPLDFAPDIPFKGYEDLRFADGWSKKDHPGFWSYVCAWNIIGNIETSEKILEYYLQIYFDGLMNIGSNTSGTEIINGTAAVLRKDTSSSYIGKLKTFDTRLTKNPMTLYIYSEVYFCKNSNSTVIIFRFSPKEFDDTIWFKLKVIDIKDGFCNTNF